MKIYFLMIFLVSLFSTIAAAEVSENTTFRNLTIVTGFSGATIQYCNADSDCVDTAWFKCFSDFDAVSSSSYTGWCNSTAITGCYHDSRNYSSGIYYCVSTTSYRQCSSGTWGSETSCTGNQTCTNLTTSSPCGTTTTTTTTSSSSSSSSNATPTPTPAVRASLAITSAIKDFDLVQNESAVKSLIAKNDGNKSLADVKLSLSGAGADVKYAISPEKFSNLTVGSTATFILNFSAHVNATVKSYSVTTEVASGDTKTSASFTLRILPSNATVEITILPLYNSLKSLVTELERNVAELENKGINTTAMKLLLADIRDKLNQTTGNIEKKDYFAASQLLDSTKILINDLKSSISKASAPGLDLISILIIVIVIVGVGVFVYLMWPSEETVRKGWTPREESKIDRILKKIKRKKETYGAS